MVINTCKFICVACVGIVFARGVVEVCGWGVVELNTWVLVDDCCCC